MTRTGKAAWILLAIFSLLLGIGYIAVDFILPLPRFLWAENIVWAILYLAPVALIAAKRWKHAVTWLLVVAPLNLGRVSRSIITPYGSLGPLAFEHIPLALTILVVLVLAAIIAWKRCSYS